MLKIGHRIAEEKKFWLALHSTRSCKYYMTQSHVNSLIYRFCLGFKFFISLFATGVLMGPSEYFSEAL